MSDKRVDRIAVDQHVELDQRRGLEMAEFVVERCVPAARRFQPVEEIEHHLGKRHFVLQRHLTAEKQHLLLHAALFAAQGEHRADVVRGHQDVGGDDGFAQLGDAVLRRQFGRVVHIDDRAVGQQHLVDDGRRARDQSRGRIRARAAPARCPCAASPRKPQRKPKPSAVETSGSKCSAESFSFSFFKASRNCS